MCFLSWSFDRFLMERTVCRGSISTVKQICFLLEDKNIFRKDTDAIVGKELSHCEWIWAHFALKELNSVALGEQLVRKGQWSEEKISNPRFSCSCLLWYCSRKQEVRIYNHFFVPEWLKSLVNFPLLPFLVLVSCALTWSLFFCELFPRSLCLRSQKAMQTTPEQDHKFSHRQRETCCQSSSSFEDAAAKVSNHCFMAPNNTSAPDVSNRFIGVQLSHILV